MKTRHPLFFRLICILILTATIGSLLSGCAAQFRTTGSAEDGIVPDEIILSFRETATEQQITAYLSRLDAVVDDTLSDIGMYRLKLPVSLSLEELDILADTLREAEIVENVYLNTVMQLSSASEKDSYIPNDPWDEEDWNTDVPEGKNWGLEAIDAPGAWQYLDQMATVNVGIIEEHVPNSSHPDLKGLIVNRQCLVIDESGNFQEADPDTMDPDNHSTRVAGIMNAAFDNGEGVSGVMGGKGKLYSYALEESEDIPDEKYYSGEITGYSFLLALKALIDQDVQVINISMGDSLSGYAATHGNQNAIDFVKRQADLATDILTRIIEERTAQGKPDFVIVIAAGNGNDDTFYRDFKAYLGYRDERTLWEKLQEQLHIDLKNKVEGETLAKYSHFLNAIEDPLLKDRIIVVGAVKIDTKNSSETEVKYICTDFSNVGDRVDLVAPGKEIYGCNVNGYALLGGTGTSFAAPHVSGVAGLIFACDPTLSGPQVKELLLSTATGSYEHGGSSCGMVNAKLAVEKTLGLLEETVPEVDAPAPESEDENVSQEEPVGHVVITEVIYPEGTWTADQKAYFDYLATQRYVDNISNPFIQEVCRERYVDNYYTFRDLDFDGTEELILWLGYTGADGEMMIFTLGKGDVQYLGSAPCDGTGTVLACADHDDDFFLVSYDGSEEYGSCCELANNELKIISTFTGPIPHRWDYVEWIGSMPLQTRIVEQPVYAEKTNAGYAEFLEAEAYIFFVENPVLFDEWMSGLTTANHWLHDIDRDGIQELIVRLGNPEGSNELLVFTLNDQNPVLIGSIPCSSYVGISVNERESGFLMVSNDGMLESITRCTLEGGSLEVEEHYMIMESGWFSLAPQS